MPFGLFANSSASVTVFEVDVRVQAHKGRRSNTIIYRLGFQFPSGLWLQISLGCFAVLDSTLRRSPGTWALEKTGEYSRMVASEPAVDLSEKAIGKRWLCGDP